MKAALSRALLLLAGVVALGWTDWVIPFPPPDVAAWTAVGPIMAVFDVARVALLAAAAYLVLLATVAGVARLFGWRRLLAGLSRTPGGRRVIKVILGTALAGSSLAAAAVPAGAGPPPGPAPVLYWGSPAPRHREHRVVDRRVTSPARVGHTWTVRPGDDLWSIAEASLRSELGRQPDQKEVARYWLAVIERNRARLPDPSDPSLLFPGDVVVLPAPDTLVR